MAFMTRGLALESHEYGTGMVHGNTHCHSAPIWFILMPPRGFRMAFYIFYVIAIAIIILHFTGWLKRNNLEWLVLVLAVAVFPAVLFL
jgi:hypothetical protein